MGGSSGSCRCAKLVAARRRERGRRDAFGVVSVQASADREDVARLPRNTTWSRYRSSTARPDRGVSTVDDVIDAIVDEQTEDVQRLGAVQPLRIRISSRASGTWCAGGWCCSWVVSRWDLTSTAMQSLHGDHRDGDVSRRIPAAGHQLGRQLGLAVGPLIIRALAVGDVEIADALRIFLRELGQGLALGACLGASARPVMVGTPHGAPFGAVIAFRWSSLVLVGTVVGSMLPLLLRRLGFDRRWLIAVRGVHRGLHRHVVYFTVARRLLGLA